MLRSLLSAALCCLCLSTSTAGVEAGADDPPDPICAVKTLTASAAEAPAVVPRPVACAARVETSITLDGVLDEPAWRQGTSISNFVQEDPDQGQAASERTVVHVVYDDEALYIGARMYDSAPDSIISRLERRDRFREDTDAFAFYVDPYLDRRTGFYFGVTVAGTRVDGVLLNDDWDDNSWDGVWEARTRIDEQGWVAEMRIPYSQLRFKQSDSYVWGVNFHRFIARHNESDYLVYTPRGESGFVSRFPTLEGITAIKPPRQIEATPYLTTKAEFLNVEAGNPFNDGSKTTPGLGADLKVGLSSNLTLDATINPDFGQVEVDPAVVNLSDVEVFFPERRPFFIEGANVFTFGRGGANNNWGFNWGNPNLFYSRRIGRAPQGSTPDATYADRPDAARILGAAKVTGQVGEGWQVGTVQALTGSAEADLLIDGQQQSAEVEPMAYYGIVRARREMRDGRHSLGLISTTTARSYRVDRLHDEFNDEAFVVGLDGWTLLGEERGWALTGWGSVSQVRGTQERLQRLQRSSLHYFQRPDAGHVSVDSSATSLTGWSGRMMLNRQQGRFRVNAAVGAISPGYNPNDLGFMWRTDVVNAHLATTYQFTEPRSFYRRINVNVASWRSYDFDGANISAGFWTGNYIQFKNFWSLWANAAFIPQRYDTRFTRGGPRVRLPQGLEYGFELDTDNRKNWVFEFGGFGFASEAQRNLGVYHEVLWKPRTNLDITVGPRVRMNRSAAQYATTVNDPTATATFGRRYLFGELDQVTYSADVRVNWTFSPDLSFQLFAQPFVSRGDYTDYKYLDAPDTFAFTTFGEGASTLSEDGAIGDPDGEGPAASIDVPDLDFNVKSLRGTAVMRWEFKPGSTLFLVWTQSRSDNRYDAPFQLGDALDQLFRAPADNIFMLKFTYWFSR